MAINIFQGSKPTKSGNSTKVNSANRTTRAKAVQAALSTPSVTSDSGATAIGKTGTLQKVGNIVGKVAGIASKFLPGIGGTIASGISNILNDPEWWQSVPGEAVTCNAPLRVIENGKVRNAATSGPFVAACRLRLAILQIASTPGATSTAENDMTVIQPTDQMVNSYLLPQIRKVVNAIPLQSVEAYKKVLAVNATLYAIWVNLKKYDYLCKHGMTYIANLDDSAFPILRVQNAAFLQSTIGRLEEYLRSNVRLPHTLCEYLAWRFGRIYRSNDSAKAALVMYNVTSLSDPINDLTTRISSLMAQVSSSTELQKANADLYNTYFDHDYQVEVREDTQVTFDRKEFCLRTNLDLAEDALDEDMQSPDCVYIDSNLDNPTTFMASTVSTRGQVTSATGDLETSLLFPVSKARVFVPFPHSDLSGALSVRFINMAQQSTTHTFIRSGNGSAWGFGDIQAKYPGTDTTTPDKETADSLSVKIAMAMLCKAVDFYNKDIYIMCQQGEGGPFAVDLTSLSMDMGLVQNQILGTEHLFAFANLVDIDRKHSMSYKQAETLVARDTANLVEKLDVATIK